MYALVYAVKNVFPETEMVINSKCANPYANWDGKILDVPVFASGFQNRPSYFNFHMENEYNESTAVTYSPTVKKQPVIIWGTHHKTGTFVAKKIFAKICAKMNWCCLFHVTRDSVHAVKHALGAEKNINVVGHNQWIWNPEDLDVNGGNYKFVHFYRHPFKKVISGYRYHLDGTEAWTQKDMDFHAVCDSPLHAVDDSKNSNISSSSSSSISDNSKSTIIHHAHEHRGPVSEKSVYEFCKHTYLCETCCRLEHEVEAPRNLSAHPHVDLSGYSPASERVHLNGNIPAHVAASRGRNHVRRRAMLKQLDYRFTPSNKAYHRREDYEYTYICKHLGTLKGSLQGALTASSAEEGVLTEAAIDYYENLKMARIVNQTYHDPRTLSIDLDVMNRDFSGAIWQILGHLQGAIPEAMLVPLHEELMFYDLQTSPLYRWSMENPMINHVAGNSKSAMHTSADLMEILTHSAEVEQLYRPVFALMGGALPKKKAKAVEIDSGGSSSKSSPSSSNASRANSAVVAAAAVAVHADKK